jgi:hypothetical protein
MRWHPVGGAVGLTALAVAAVWAGAWDRGAGLASIGALAVLALAAIGWLSSITLGLRRVVLRLRRRPDLAVAATYALVTRAPAMRYLPASFLSLLAIVPMTAYVGAEPRPPLAFVGFPIAAAVASLLVASWTYGAHIDVAARRVSRWVGVRIGPLVLPLWKRVHALEAGAQVELDEAFRSTGKHGGYHVHTIHVATVLVHEHRDADVARLRAEALAKALALAVVDRTCVIDEVRRRAVHELDLPIAAQLAPRGLTAGRRQLPFGSTLTIEDDDLPWRVRIPAQGLRAVDVVVGLVITGFGFALSLIPAAVIAAIAGRLDKVVVLSLAAAICAVTTWFALWRMVLRTRLETQQIRLSPSGIAVVRSAPGSRRDGELAAERIEEVVITDNRERGGEGLCIVARGDGVSLAFGHGLQRDDACWLRDTAIAAIAPSALYR